MVESEHAITQPLPYGVIGNTSDFGSDILGSSPSRVTLLREKLGFLKLGEAESESLSIFLAPIETIVRDRKSAFGD